MKTRYRVRRFGRRGRELWDGWERSPAANPYRRVIQREYHARRAIEKNQFSGRRHSWDNVSLPEPYFLMELVRREVP